MPTSRDRFAIESPSRARGDSYIGLVILIGCCLGLSSGCSQISKDATTSDSPGTLHPATAHDLGEPVPASGELSDYPFTVEQLRTGNPPGLLRRLRRVDRGVENHIEFLVSRSDAQGIAFDVCPVAADGTPVANSETTPTQSWEGLRGHAAFDSGQTRVSQEQLETAIGNHACTVYRSTPSTQVVEESYFSHSLPGLPILYRRIVNGHVVIVMEIVHVERPRAD